MQFRKDVESIRSDSDENICEYKKTLSIGLLVDRREDDTQQNRRTNMKFEAFLDDAFIIAFSY